MGKSAICFYSCMILQHSIKTTLVHKISANEILVCESLALDFYWFTHLLNQVFQFSKIRKI